MSENLYRWQRTGLRTEAADPGCFWIRFEGEAQDFPREVVAAEPLSAEDRRDQELAQAGTEVADAILEFCDLVEGDEAAIGEMLDSAERSARAAWAEAQERLRAHRERVGIEGG